ncbi:MAG: oligosaccharide flippase family protein [Candidatus Eremiobacteraeota bacterium]|nr:oligosaccharide flippase family protein [Candidatus Eremiobacteraeota bacterium]MBC5828324.1 oligosaccharide flippase family protein [Candidatus Eremiobacteraeota bacterium]
MSVAQEPVNEQGVSLKRGAFSLRSFAGDAGLIVGGALLANVFSFAYHFTVSRLLGPDRYGTLATLLAISSMVGVLGGSIGTVAMQETARLWALHLDAAIAPFVRRLARLAVVVGGLTAAGTLIVSLPISRYLHIVQPALWIIFAAFIGMATVSSFVRGAVQGAHRFGLFAASMSADGLCKLVIALALVRAGLGTAGAAGGLLAGAAIAGLIAFMPMLRLGAAAVEPVVGEHLRFGGESVKVLTVSAGTTALMFVDMLFAKHHLSGVQAGYYGAAGTIARIIPYAVGVIALVLMPKAAAAHHTSRESLSRLLTLTFGLGAAAAVIGVALTSGASGLLIGLSYGPKYLAAAPLLRLYGADAALLGLVALGTACLVALRDYSIAPYLAAAVAVDAVAMAVWGTSATHLLTVAIAVNALLLPFVGVRIAAALRTAPQAPSPLLAEVFS